MTTELKDILDTYRRDGFVGPLAAFDSASCPNFSSIIAVVSKEIEHGANPFTSKRNRHLDLPSIGNLLKVPYVVDVARTILGEDLIVWRTHIFAATQDQGLGWHRDTYSNLLADTREQTSIHMALSDATKDNCVLVLPGSHVMSDEELDREGFIAEPFGMTAVYGAPTYRRDPTKPAKWKPMILRPGEFFVFHPNLVHGSIDNICAETGTGGRAPVIRRLTGRLRRKKIRHAIVFRIASAKTQVYPAAFEEVEGRDDGCVLLSGNASNCRNRLVDLAATTGSRVFPAG